jgi:hypothetical protein
MAHGERPTIRGGIMDARITRLVLAGLAAGLATPSPAACQFRDARPVDRTTVQVGLEKPLFKDTELGFATFVVGARVLQPIRDNVTAFAGLDLAHATLDGYPSSTTVSNPRLGFVFGSTEGGYAEASVSVPLSKEFGDDDYATGVGFMTDIERVDRFIEDLLTVNAAFVPLRRLGSGATVGARVEGSVWIPTGEDADTELFARYAAFGSIPAGALELTGEVSGLMVVTEGDLSIAERTNHSLSVGAGLRDVRVRPGLFVRIPLDGDLREEMGAVVGLRLAL